MDTALAQLEPLVALVRPHLLPIISALPQPLHTFGLSQLGPECYQKIVGELDLSDAHCTKLAISKAIGVGIVALSTVVKVPQLLKLVRSRSAQGISFASYLLETSAYIITLAYNVRSGNPFSTYGEIAILALQNVVISLLVLHYKGKDTMAAAYAAGLATAVYALFNESVLPKEVLVLVQAATIPLGLASKIPQIWTIAKEKSTGQLSAFAVFNYLFGSLARIFTTLAEVDDPIILIGFLGGFALNVVLAAQMLYYWNSSSDSNQAAKPQKQQLSAPAPATSGRKSPKPKSARRKA
ncbi:hypothetical protein FN846DRAFT_53936 [Sphaerosporella brunnea]|uniref:Mannose-P-dolichol utilization defect 1 protein homolog n=1 Tax=Sphaerosporella brunnea TaxID=1250544 RepID=A0A5J5EUA0_9PEZI|nr:hypothetical protein FN846DRAFT_53936 [Sphaerosporella brunnea]